MLHPTIFNTAQVCHQFGIKHAVMSPGSRNAPLTISFARHPEIKKWIIPDERSAGFIALGIAQKTNSPVVLCCTSGTALLNYSPAIAEAFYREIPLIVLSADRPAELIDQRDGQTIRQFEVLKNHVRSSTQLPLINSDAASTDYLNLLIESLKKSVKLPKGPVHINIPFAEPFYPTGDESLRYQEVEIEIDEPTYEVNPKIEAGVYQNILVLVGQRGVDPELDNVLKEVSNQIPVLRFPLNNLAVGIEHVDLFIDQQEELKADLLITSGLSVLSKKLKNFLRKHIPKKHIHFDPAGIEVDTFQSNPEIVKSSLTVFLKHNDFSKVDTAYLNVWHSYASKTSQALNDFDHQSPFSESLAAKDIMHALPKDAILHLSNSMPVRYADMFGKPDGVECFSNRGTSGIDGCTSTALGTSLVTDKLNLLVTGDLAFLYDRNAFFHNHSTPNLRIIVLNNQGGGIFRLIDGPANLPELEEYFETRHNRTAEYICAENKLEYLKASDRDTLKSHLTDFFRLSKSTKILEVFTDPETNQRVYKELKKYVYERVKN